MDIALGMKYPVLSQGQSLDVDTPDSMGFEINQALQNLKQAIGGDVDAFVQGRLKYLTKVSFSTKLYLLSKLTLLHLLSTTWKPKVRASLLRPDRYREGAYRFCYYSLCSQTR
jgi:hypothetical protein